MNEIEVLFHFSSCYKAFNSKNIYQHLPTFNGKKENTKGNIASDLLMILRWKRPLVNLTNSLF